MVEQSAYTPEQLLGYEKFWDIISTEKTYYGSALKRGLEQGMKQGLEQGLEQGRRFEIFTSVQEGDYSIERGAQKMNLSVAEFTRQMTSAGYKVPVNA